MAAAPWAMEAEVVQTLIVLLVVAGAAFYVGRRMWRTVAAARATRRDAAGCGAGCGCEAPVAPVKRSRAGL